MLLAYCGTITKLLWETDRADLIDRYVGPMIRGERLGGFAWSEGRDPFSFATALRKDGSGFTLRGEKGPIANGLIADVVMVFAANEQTGDLTAVLVERDDPGVEVRPYSAMGLRASGMGKWRFSDVTLAPERVLVQVDALSYGQRFLNERRFEMPCWALGRMRTLFDACATDMNQRIRYGLPLAEMQTIQAAVGKMYIGLESSRLVVKDMLERVSGADYDWLWDAPLAVAKSHVIEQALQMCRIIQDITGGYGVFEDAPYERHIRDLQCLNPIAGTLATLGVDLGMLAMAEVGRSHQRARINTKEK
jgi:alkylation response protein AidB-like acyl-CoA dehydrogenase